MNEHPEPDLYWDTSPVAREDREQLRAENERLQKQYDKLEGIYNRAILRERRLREALRRYGQHMGDCASMKVGGRWEDCDCNLRAALGDTEHG